MKKKKIKIIIMIALTFACLIIPFKRETKMNYEQNPIIERQSPNVMMSSKVISEKLESINKIEIMRSSLKEEIEITGKWNNWAFKNNQTITVKGGGIYRINLDDIEIIQGNNEVTVLVELENEVAIYDLQTKTEKGILTLYEREFTSEEYNSIILNSREKMLNEMMKSEYTDIVKQRGTEIIKAKINEISKQLKVNVRWI